MKAIISSPARLIFALCLLILPAWLGFAQANNPVPLINQPLVPDAVAPGGPAFTLTVNGTGFVAASVVHWNGSPRATTFVSSSQLTAAISAADIFTATSAYLTVANPAPGGGTSNAVAVQVSVPAASTSLSASDFPLAAGYTSVTTGDFNGDGHLDFAAVVGNNNSPQLFVFLGNGDGTFQSPLVSTVPFGSVTLIAADFNGDGKLDLAIVTESSFVNVFLGNGDGTFGSPVITYDGQGSNSPTALAVADFNGDGKLDLAVAGYRSGSNAAGAAVLFGNGDGTFQVGGGGAAAPFVASVAVGDFNGDGILDIATAGQDGAYVIFGNGGGGSFSSPVVYPTNTNETAFGLVAADFNGDGHLDLAVVNANFCLNPPCPAPGSVSILLGNADGSFQPPVDYPTAPAGSGGGDGPEFAVVADFNADGKLDLVTGDTLEGALSVFLGNGDGTFQAAIVYPDTFGVSVPVFLAAGDFNSSGLPGIVTVYGVTGPTVASVYLQVPIKPVVTLSNTSLAFGSEKIGVTSNPMSSTLTNTGSAPLDIAAISLTGANAGDFATTNTCGTILVVGAACTISVTFTPTALGARTASVSITDNASGSPQTISLSGTGVGPVVTLSPANLVFRNQLLGTSSAAKNATLKNTGNATLIISSISTTGDFSQTNTCGSSVAVKATCTISVTFTPTGRGVRTGSVVIADNALGSPQTAALKGTGTSVMLAPPLLTFATQALGTVSAAQPVTLTNTGTTLLTISNISIGPPDSIDFAETNTCGASVAPGASCTISVTFMPTASGARTATLSIADNGGGSPQTVALTGTGTVVSLSATSLNFGNVMVGKISGPKSVILTNVGSTTLIITSIAVIGTDKGDFSEGNTCGGSVPAGGTCSIVVHFLPTKTGLRTASVSITDNGGGSPQSIALSGTGT